MAAQEPADRQQGSRPNGPHPAEPSHEEQMLEIDGPPLTARSVIASTLLGTEPPRLPVGFLVRAGEMFGFSEASIRTALSRMAVNGEVNRVDPGRHEIRHYELTGQLVSRQTRLREGRTALTIPWQGSWTMYVVSTTSRSSADRAQLRIATKRLRMGELREGVWLRPSNLDPRRLEEDRSIVDSQCLSFESVPAEDGRELVRRVWDLGGWATKAQSFQERLQRLMPRLVAGDMTALRPGFILSAAVLRHFGADPLLPEGLLPSGWPGAELRSTYTSYDQSYRVVLGEWISAASRA